MVGMGCGGSGGWMAPVVCPSTSDPGSDRSFVLGFEGGALNGAFGSCPGVVGGSGTS